MRAALARAAVLAATLTLATSSLVFASGGTTASGADLQISGSASTGSPDPGGALRYTFGVKNSGPETAMATTFSDALPAGFSFAGASVNGVASACAYDGATVTCALGNLASSGSATVVVNTLASTVLGSYANTGSVVAATTDPKPTNNAVTITVSTKVSGKVVCVPLATMNATSGYVPGAMVLTATYSLDPCTSRATVTVQVVNAATGAIAYSVVDPGTDLTTGLNTTTWSLPDFSTTYRVNFIVSDKKNGGLYQEASTTTTTPAAVANCATITKNSLTSGYWITYAALWESFQAADCGYGREHVEIRITNVATGAVVYDSAYWGMSGLLDYEGPVVQYSTWYQFDVEVHGAFGEILDAQSQTIESAPQP